jgi:hypothetical protein
MLKSKLRIKAERLYSDKIYRRHDINKELKTMDWPDPDFDKLFNEDNKLRIEINLLSELLKR